MKELIGKQSTFNLIEQLEIVATREMPQRNLDLITDAIYEELEKRHPEKMDDYFSDIENVLSGTRALRTILVGL